MFAQVFDKPELPTVLQLMQHNASGHSMPQSPQEVSVAMWTIRLRMKLSRYENHMGFDWRQLAL